MELRVGNRRPKAKETMTMLVSTVMEIQTLEGVGTLNVGLWSLDCIPLEMLERPAGFWSD